MGQHHRGSGGSGGSRGSRGSRGSSSGGNPPNWARENPLAFVVDTPEVSRGWSILQRPGVTHAGVSHRDRQ